MCGALILLSGHNAQRCTQPAFLQTARAILTASNGGAVSRDAAPYIASGQFPVYGVGNAALGTLDHKHIAFSFTATTSAPRNGLGCLALKYLAQAVT